MLVFFGFISQVFLQVLTFPLKPMYQKDWLVTPSLTPQLPLGTEGVDIGAGNVRNPFLSVD